MTLFRKSLLAWCDGDTKTLEALHGKDWDKEEPVVFYDDPDPFMPTAEEKAEEANRFVPDEAYYALFRVPGQKTR